MHDCLAAVSPHDHFCPACGGPLTSHASTDPLGHILAEGYAYRQAIRGRPSMLVLLGVWAIFGPQMLGMAWLVGGVQAAFTPFGLFTLAGLCAMLLLYGTILAKVTANRFFLRSGE